MEDSGVLCPHYHRYGPEWQPARSEFLLPLLYRSRWRDGNPSFVELVDSSAIMALHGRVLPLDDGVVAGDHVLARPLDGAVGNPQNEDGIDQGATGISHVMEKKHRRSVAMILLSSEEDRCCSWRCQRRLSPPDRPEAAGARTARSS